MSDLDRILEQLEKVILTALNSADSSGGVGKAEETLSLNGVFTARVSARVRYLDELDPGPSKDLASRAPVIDVFEQGDRVKVVVHLPGVRKEDIVLLSGPRSLRIEITKGGEKFIRDIPCGANLDSVSVKSSVENNSVVEITLHDPHGGRPR
jgi:HSP20 family molecular chaperone IbpA